MRPDKEVTDAAELLRWVVGMDTPQREVAENVLATLEWLVGHPGGEWLTKVLAEVRADRERWAKPNLSSSRVRARIEAGRKVAV